MDVRRRQFPVRKGKESLCVQNRPPRFENRGLFRHLEKASPADSVRPTYAVFQRQQTVAERRRCRPHTETYARRLLFGAAGFGQRSRPARQAGRKNGPRKRMEVPTSQAGTHTNAQAARMSSVRVVNRSLRRRRLADRHQTPRQEKKSRGLNSTVGSPVGGLRPSSDTAKAETARGDMIMA